VASRGSRLIRSLDCQSGSWAQQVQIWNEVPPSLVASFPVNGPQRQFIVSLTGIVPSTANYVRIYIESIDGDSDTACGTSTGGCHPVRSSVIGYDKSGASNSIRFLNQQKSGTGIWSAASYAGQLPAYGNQLIIDKGAGIINTQGGGMNAYIYVIGYM